MSTRFGTIFFLIFGKAINKLVLLQLIMSLYHDKLMDIDVLDMGNSSLLLCSSNEPIVGKSYISSIRMQRKCILDII